MERCRPRDGEMQAQRCRDAGAEMWRCKSLCILYICLYIYITYIYIYTYRKEEGKKECAAPGLSRNKTGQETKKGGGEKKKGKKGKKKNCYFCVKVYIGPSAFRELLLQL